MKNSLKILLKKDSLLIIAIFALALFARFYNFDNRVVYGPEQAISLISAAENLKAPSLLGIPYLLRQTSGGFSLFTSPIFGYTLIPMILAFNYNIFGITALFALINILTGLVLFFIAKKIFGIKTAIFSLILFLFSDYMIYHSLFIWISNYMPLIGVATVYLIYKFIRESDKKALWVLLLGLISGIGFGIQYLYLFGVILFIALIIWKSRNKIIDLIFFVFGLGIGELPTVLFDLKHNFYNVRTLWTYFVDTLHHPGQSQISYYHFLVLWPVAAILAGIILTKLYKRNKYLSAFLVLVYIIINLLSPRISFTHAIGMPENLTAENVLSSAKAISDDNSTNFNVSVLMDFDNRGYVLRYPLQFIYKRNIRGVEDYPRSGEIYVLSRKDYDFSKPDIWEVSSFQPYKVSIVKSINSDYAVFRLVR